MASSTISYNARWHQVQFLSLWYDSTWRLNPGLQDHWWTLYPLVQTPGYIRSKQLPYIKFVRQYLFKLKSITTSFNTTYIKQIIVYTAKIPYYINFQIGGAQHLLYPTLRGQTPTPKGHVLVMTLLTSDGEIPILEIRWVRNIPSFSLN